MSFTLNMHICIHISRDFINVLPICRFVTQLLSDLIYFVTMQESHNSTGDPLKVEMTKPKDCRERQKLLREQNILKQVRGLKGYLVKKKMIYQKLSRQRVYKLWKLAKDLLTVKKTLMHHKLIQQ